VSAETGTLILRRPRNAWRDRMRAYQIRIDGSTRLTVRRGEERTVDLQPGLHRVRAKIDWSGSPEVEVVIDAGLSTTCLVEPAGSLPSVVWRAFTRTRYLKLTTSTP